MLTTNLRMDVCKPFMCMIYLLPYYSSYCFERTKFMKAGYTFPSQSTGIC